MVVVVGVCVKLSNVVNFVITNMIEKTLVNVYM